MRNQKGITLIALVITIIVLLILAGVSIAMLTGENGLLTRANEAKEDTKVAEVVERINMELNAIYADALTGRNTFDSSYVAGINTNLAGQATAVLTNENKITITGTGAYNTITGYVDASTNPATIDAADMPS